MVGREWKECFVFADQSLLEAMQVIDRSGRQIAIVVNRKDVLVGVVTDGDLRRALLAGLPMHAGLQGVMNENPIFVKNVDTKDYVLTVMRQKGIHQIPVVDDQHKVIDVYFIDEIFQVSSKSNLVVLMAGGLGKRLGNLTENCPKPMLKIGDKPILETIICGLVQNGFHEIVISINYLGHIIQEYFGAGEKFGAKISYVSEAFPLGTAGALSLLPKKPQESFIVMNADLLTRIDYTDLLAFHEKKQSMATMCVREYQTEVPYGVVNISDGGRIGSIEEKPIQTHYVNAGIYVLHPKTLDVIPQNEFFNMTSLFEVLIQKRQKVVSYPLREYWLDVGLQDDFTKAQNEFAKNFSNH